MRGGGVAAWGGGCAALSFLLLWLGLAGGEPRVGGGVVVRVPESGLVARGDGVLRPVVRATVPARTGASETPSIPDDPGSSTLGAIRPPEPFAPGATAELRGRVVTVEGAVLPGIVRLSAGLSQGRSAQVRPDGSFEFAGLYPGFAVLSVPLPGDPLERELSLRPGLPTNLVVDLTQRSECRGRVVDGQGRPLGGVQVEVDGLPVWSDGAGEFTGSRRASGRAWVMASHPGHAPCRAELRDGGAPLVLTLQPACRLEVSSMGGTPLELVYVIPGSVLGADRPHGSRTYPWATRGQLRVGNGLACFPDLPPGEVRVLAFGAGGFRGSATLHLGPGEPHPLELELQKAPSRTAGTPLLRALARTLGPDARLVRERPLEDLARWLQPDA